VSVQGPENVDCWGLDWDPVISHVLSESAVHPFSYNKIGLLAHRGCRLLYCVLLFIVVIMQWFL